MTKAPSCCHAEEDAKHAHSKKRFDVLFWGSLIGVACLFILGIFFPNEIANYPWLETMAHTAHHVPRQSL